MKKTQKEVMMKRTENMIKKIDKLQATHDKQKSKAGSSTKKQDK